MDEKENAELKALGLNADNLNSEWHTLSPRLRALVGKDLVALHKASLLNEDLALVLVKNPYYSSGLVALILQLHALKISHRPYFSTIVEHAFAAQKLTNIFKKLSGYGYEISESRVTCILTTTEHGALNYSIELLHKMGLLNDARLDTLLSETCGWVRSYADMLVNLVKKGLLSQESKLLGIHPSCASSVSLCVEQLQTMLQPELFERLLTSQEDAECIATGLEILTVRLPHFKIEDVVTVIACGKNANFAAECLSFLFYAGLLVDGANRERLLPAKDALSVVVFFLYQLKCNKSITQDRFIQVIDVAPLVAKTSVLMHSLDSVKWIEPLLLRRIDALLEELKKLRECTEDEKAAITKKCSMLITKGSELPSQDLSASSSADPCKQ